MIVVSLFILAVLCIAIFPMLILFILPAYMALDGLASRQFIYNFKVALGGTNIYFIDMIYAAAVILTILGILRMFMRGGLGKYTATTRKAILLAICYLIFFIVKLVNGYFSGLPLDALVRRFALDTQIVYMFIPLFYLKKEDTLKKLLYFVILSTLLFPIGQPFLYGTADQVSLEMGQGGTLRLGSGNANILLMLGALALFVWEKKIWLSALPLAGMAMLAHRSAFVSIAFCVLVISVMKKKSAKFIALMALAGLLLIATLVIIQTTLSVPVVDKAAERLGQTFEKTGTTEARINSAPMIFGAYIDKPFVGFSYHDLYVFRLKENRSAFAFNMLHPHSFVFSAMLRTGTIGTLILFILIFLTMRAAWRISRNRETREIGMFLFSTNLFFLVYGLMNTTFNSAGHVYWVLAGITLWYLEQLKIQKQQQRSIEQ